MDMNPGAISVEKGTRIDAATVDSLAKTVHQQNITFAQMYFTSFYTKTGI